MVFAGAIRTLPAGKSFLGRLRILAYPLLFFVIEGLRDSGLAWLSDGWNLTGLTGLIMFYALAGELHGHQRQQRWILPRAMRHPMFRVAVSAAVLAAVWYVPAPKTSFDNYVPIGGAVLMLLSVPVFSRRPLRAVMAESLALLGALAAGELLWLAPALVVVQAAWILDFHLGCVKSAGSPNATTSPAPFWPYFYPVLAVASAAVIGVKLVGHGVPYHMLMQ